ncbi:MAG TPA: BON domain-containing protein [Candidatus Acidoferrum sp.]|nr:BON domain-containing protein [Candidatus Acidoferrum sp.]
MRTKTTTVAIALWLATAAALISSAGCAGDRHHQSAGEQIDDRVISTRVKNALGDDVQFKYPLVEVKTFKGTVQLSGFADSAEQKSRAGDIAKRIEGVKDVENRITIKK